MNKLFYEKKPAFEQLANEKDTIRAYGEGYKTFLDEGKTERDAVEFMKSKAESHGFKAYTRGMKLTAGDKIYQINRNKGIILAVIGSESLAKGTNITGAHLDAPRIDIRTIPLYEEEGMAFLKTHYYGGIKKYQWPTIPLELRGVVSRYTKNGVQQIDIHIGNKENDPVFVITDLLPHLATEQMQKTMVKGFQAENMNILVGSEPSTSDKDCAHKVKLAVLEYLNQEYGMTEQDFVSAEISAVPAYNARDIGFDRSFIGAYGHDDRVCSYAAATSLFALDNTPKRTSICLLVDKEETGSEGVTGMQSKHFDTFISDICRAQDVLDVECLENSICLSADVCNAFDPNYPEVSEKRNDAKVNCGLVIVKYTGSRGKSGTSDASSELMAKVRYILDANKICWQTGQLGKVDQGGGGTIAMYMANRNIDTVDAGVPVLSMHSPFEVISKIDLYSTYKGFKAFYEFEN